MVHLKDIEGFDWDEGNIHKNYEKHGITNREAENVFGSKPLITEKSKYENEERFQAFSESNGKFITAIFTIRKNKIRIISARTMNKKERSFYNAKVKEEVEADSKIQLRR